MKPSLMLLTMALAQVAAFSADSFPLQVHVSREDLQPGSIVLFKVQGPRAAVAEAKIMDVDGHAITKLNPAGADVFAWDGRDSRGRNVHPGTYLIEIVEEPYLWNGAVSVVP